jgi:hypothetical protein
VFENIVPVIVLMSLHLHLHQHYYHRNYQDNQYEFPVLADDKHPVVRDDEDHMDLIVVGWIQPEKKK